MKKILVGMSGGVDSSAAALLLINQGYEISGCTLKLSDGADNNADDAKAVCDKLGIDHFVFDMRELFREKVIDKFAESYIKGETPNPCIECNRHIKFGAMLDKALELGFDGIATGHYADIRYSEYDGRYLLTRPLDRKKDQTYVLYGMTQFQLARTLFPLCNTGKDEIRRLAEENGLVNAHRPDSQDICFVPDNNYAGFIENHTGRTFPEGDFVDTEGKVIGRHKGYIRYTVGQRRGLGIALGEPVYVCGKDPENNTVTLTTEKVYADTVTAEDVNFISVPEICGEMPVTARVRYNMQPAEGILTYLGDGKIRVKFTFPTKALADGRTVIYTDSAVTAPAKGQALVVYDGDKVVCGGKIMN